DATAVARTLASGSFDAPISALTTLDPPAPPALPALPAPSCPTNSAALARINAPCDRSIASFATSPSTRASPADAAYSVSAVATAATRFSLLPYHRSIVDAAHSGDLSSWHVVHAFGTPYFAVNSGTGAANVCSRRRVISRQFTSLI